MHRTVVTTAAGPKTPPRLGLTVRLLVYLLTATVVMLVAFLIAAGGYLRQVSRTLVGDGRELSSSLLDRMSEVLEKHLLDAYQVQAAEEARRLDQSFAEIVRVVDMMARSAAQAGEDGPLGTIEAVHWSRFNDAAARPRDLRPDAGRGVDISWAWPVYKTPPGVTPDLGSVTRFAQLRDLFVLLARSHGDLVWLYVGLPDGLFVGFPGNGNFSADFDPRTRPWYRGAVAKPGTTAWTEPYVDVLTERLTVTCARSFSTPSRKVAGVVAADVSLEAVRTWIGQAGREQGATAIMVDGRGRIVASAMGGAPAGEIDARLAEQGDEAMQRAAEQMAQGGSGAEHVMRGGERWFLAYAPISQVGWSLAVLYPARRFEGMRRENASIIRTMFDAAEATTVHQFDDLQQRFVVAMILACIALMAAVGAILTFRLSAPINRFILDINAIAAGDLTREVRAMQDDELGQLASAFNEMTRQLRRTRDQLREINRNLELKVDERTRELALRNQELNRVYREVEQAYTKLKAAQSQLIHQERMATLGQLMAGIAHEINNPVNFLVNAIRPLNTTLTRIGKVLQMYDEAEALEPLDSHGRLQDIRRYKTETRFGRQLQDADAALELIRNGAERTGQIVRNLRTFSRGELTELKLTDIGEAIDVTLSLLAHLIKGRIAVHRAYGNLPAVECNPGQMNQVLMNLLSNAAQSINGPGDLWITLAEENGWARIKIRDSGCGIAPENLYRVFEPFFTTKAAPQGTGLGLSISLSIVQQHGGTIEVRSDVGVGTEFTVSVPMRQSGEMEAMAPGLVFETATEATVEFESGEEADGVSSTLETIPQPVANDSEEPGRG